MDLLNTVLTIIGLSVAIIYIVSEIIFSIGIITLKGKIVKRIIYIIVLVVLLLLSVLGLVFCIDEIFLNNKLFFKTN